MNENEKTIIALLEEQNALLYDVLNLSEPVRLSSDDAELYIELMEARQAKFDSMSVISESLVKLGFDQSAALSEGISGSTEFSRRVSDLCTTAKATSYRIREIDLSQKPIVEEIKNSLSEQRKVLNERKNVKDLYSDDNMPNSRHYFDQTK